MGDGADVATKWVYSFGGGNSDGSASMKNLLGGKGANLAEMASLGLPVPPGFTLTTDVCTAYYDLGESYPEDLSAQVDEALAALEAKTGKVFSSFFPEKVILHDATSIKRMRAAAQLARVLSSMSVRMLANSQGNSTMGKSVTWPPTSSTMLGARKPVLNTERTRQLSVIAQSTPKR